MSLLRKFLKNESGVTTIEYGIVAFLIGVVAAGAMAMIGSDVSDQFKEVSDEIGKAKSKV